MIFPGCTPITTSAVDCCSCISSISIVKESRAHIHSLLKYKKSSYQQNVKLHTIHYLSKRDGQKYVFQKRKYSFIKNGNIDEELTLWNRSLNAIIISLGNWMMSGFTFFRSSVSYIYAAILWRKVLQYSIFMDKNLSLFSPNIYRWTLDKNNNFSSWHPAFRDQSQLTISMEATVTSCLVFKIMHRSWWTAHGTS